MNGRVIAKKYVSALMKTLSDSELSLVHDNLMLISTASSSKKYNNILLSPVTSSAEKESLVLSFVENTDDKFVNFIKLLSENGRLALIPIVRDELAHKLARKNNAYVGQIISNYEVDAAIVADIEGSLSNKLGSQITLETKVVDFPGVKVEVRDLGVEVSFSTARLQSQMVEHILKAI